MGSNRIEREKEGGFEVWGWCERELVCEERENERENKLNTYLFAFGIKNEAMSKKNYSGDFELERVKRKK